MANYIFSKNIAVVFNFATKNIEGNVSNFGLSQS